MISTPEQPLRCDRGGLTELLCAMAAHAVSATDCASRALLVGDPWSVEDALSLAEILHQLNASLEQRCCELMTNRRLSPGEFQWLAAGLRISSSLERIGDLSLQAAQQARMRFPRPSIPASLRASFEPLTAVGLEIVTEPWPGHDHRTGAETASAEARLTFHQSRLLFELLSASHGQDSGAVIDVAMLARYYDWYVDQAGDIARWMLPFTRCHLGIGGPPPVPARSE